MTKTVPRDVHDYPASFEDIPGTRVFTAKRARHGYHLNRFAMRPMDHDNRERFRTDERAYLDGFKEIDGVEVVSLVGRAQDKTQAMADTFDIPHATINVDDMLAKDEPRSWTDHRLWHHSARTIDIFQYLTGEEITEMNILQGPVHDTLGIAMDMSIQMKTAKGQILTLALSFNNDGPLGTFFRYICDNGTYIARYDDLVTGREEAVDVSDVDISMNGIELQDREFIAAIREDREPNGSVAQVMPCCRAIGELASRVEAA